MSSQYGAIENTEEVSEASFENEKLRTGNKFSEIFKRRRCTCDQNTVFGLGHVINDLCAAMWFSYMMLFFQAVMEMRAAAAGAMLLLGQIVDAVATPIVGLLADRYSNKKSWHLAGCILISLSFPLLFLRCPGCEIAPEDLGYLIWWMPVYYSVLIVIFQIGWAVVQISHLAMIPDISDSQQVRSQLTSIRYMASVTSSITVYLITWVILKSTNYSTFIGPDDDYKFRDVSLTISGIGIVSWLIFHAFFKIRGNKSKLSNGHGVNESSSAHLLPEDKNDTQARVSIIEFLKSPLLYQSSFLYVFSRLYWALSLVYVPLFLEERLSINPTDGSELVASVPLVLYISSFLSSLFVNITFKSKFTNGANQIAYMVGSCMSLSSCIWIAAIEPTTDIVQIYLVAALIGAGSSITLVSSLCVTADFIGPNSNQSAVIYSIVTFADKLVTGIAVVAIENYKCTDESECPQYYRGVLTYACGGSALLGIISLTITKITSLKKPNLVK